MRASPTYLQHICSLRSFPRVPARALRQLYMLFHWLRHWLPRALTNAHARTKRCALSTESINLPMSGHAHRHMRQLDNRLVSRLAIH
jgi:hypothetical protein